jgi:hypothetical protein
MSTSTARRVNGKHFARSRSAIADVTAPRATGLPNWKVVCWFPLLLLLIFLGFVAFGVTGSSTGMWWSAFGTGTDPDLILGVPRAIRSDEWLVQSGWVVSQVEQGFPRFNGTFPGGSDASVFNDLPVWDWSTLFRPHAIGFMVLPLDQGMAVRWWLPGMAMVAAAYLLLVTLMPRRPFTAAAIAAVFALSPTIQWFYLPVTIWPPAWAMLTMAAVVWSLRDPRRWVRVLYAVATGYLTVTMVLSIYVPFIVAAAVVAVLFCISVFVQHARPAELGLRTAYLRIFPLVVAALSAATIIAVWVITRRDSISALLSTVYPGQRLQATGALDFDGVVSLLGGPFDESLVTGASGILGTNSTEAAAPLLIGIFLLIPLLWITVRDWRAERYLHWTVLAISTATLIVLAFLLLPGWDWLAHLILIDRTTAPRIRLSLALLSVLAIALLIRRLDRGDISIPWSISWITTGLAVGSLILVWSALATANDPGLTGSPHWVVLSVLFVLSVLSFTRRWVVFGVVTMSLVAVALGAPVNPLYHGVFDLNDTAIGERVQSINSADPGAWVGVGPTGAEWPGIAGFAPTAVLDESGVQAYNGVQTYPSNLMWQQIDPDGRYSKVWNRLANVSWTAGTGEPVPTLLVSDQIVLPFDSCSSFAQAHVRHVLTIKPLDQPCLTQVDQVTEGPTDFHIYRVTH